MTRKARDNPVDRLPDWRTTLPLARASPRCGAKTRRGSRADRQQWPTAAVGCTESTGPRTAEGLERMRRAKTKHGLYSAETLQLMRAVRTLRRDARRVADDL